jgi:uncharacterized membrane protein
MALIERGNILVLALLLFVVDIPWLYGISAWSNSMIRAIQGSSIEFNSLAAAVVYLALGYLLTIPTSTLQAFMMGSATYAVYDFTNLAILKNYSPTFAVADTLWGGTLFAIAYNLKEYFKL